MLANTQRVCHYIGVSVVRGRKQHCSKDELRCMMSSLTTRRQKSQHDLLWVSSLKGHKIKKTHSGILVLMFKMARIVSSKSEDNAALSTDHHCTKCVGTQSLCTKYHCCNGGTPILVLTLFLGSGASMSTILAVKQYPVPSGLDSAMVQIPRTRLIFPMS